MPSSDFPSIFSVFTLKRERENFKDIMQSIKDAIPYRGTNLWVLIFAILIASIGLNLNATAVIIGAMLISPLMGPIIGIGVSIAINDSSLLRQSIKSFFFSISIGLFVSMIYFWISPLGQAHSELLARTSPTIYDVLIALFGGFAGIIAVSSQKKGNVIPGVAIATALMPPLCTAGYGIASGNLSFLFGAIYLFFINSVFIAFSSFVVARFLRFPYKDFPDDDERKRSRTIILIAVAVTIIPSIYFGYDMIDQNRFSTAANKFIEHEAHFPGDYLLKKTIDAKTRTISLVYGGKPITQKQIDAVKRRLKIYNIADATLEIKQGFASLYETPKNEPQTNQNEIKINELTAALAEKESELQNLAALKELRAKNAEAIIEEMQILSPKIINFTMENGTKYHASGSSDISIALIGTATGLTQNESTTIVSWLKKRIDNKNIEVITKIMTPPISVFTGTTTSSGILENSASSGTTSHENTQHES